MKLKVLKCWHGPHHIVVWQAAVVGASAAAAHRVFVTLDANPATFGMRITLEKPSGLGGEQAFINLLCKHVRTPLISAILREEATGDVWCLLHGASRDQPDWFVELARSMPPELRLVSARREVLVRWGTGGTYTKVRTMEGALPVAGGEGFVDIMTPALELVAQPAPPAETPAVAAAISSGDVEHGARQKALASRLRRRLKTVAGSIAKTERQLAAMGEPERLQREAELLQAWSYRIKLGARVLELSEAECGIPAGVRLDIDAALSPGENVDRAFSRWKKARRGREMALEHLESIRREARRMEEDLQRLGGGALADDEIDVIEKRHRLPVSQTRKDTGKPVETKPWRVFQIDPVFTVLVGKSAADNDLLTKKAKANDTWLHYQGGPGSHVVIVTPRGGAAPSPAVLRAGAVLAIHYSQRRNDRSGEVCVTTKQWLRKRKDSPPGQWQVNRSQTMFVRYDDEELQLLLATRVSQ